MNNLKRILSLALAGVMTLGMMTVGAGAAFVDTDDITNIAAVETSTALGIIKGVENEDGTFNYNPNGLVNRAEAATMIVRALNGGEVPNLGLATMYDGTFSDVTADQWFAEAIYYCYQANIIAGRGDGTFDPAGHVTGYELAKMVLGALGYNASVNSTFAFTGSNWYKTVMAFATTLKTGADAQGNGGSTISLFSGMPKCKPGENMTRDEAAQIIYNGLQANTLDSSWNGSIDANGNLTYALTYGANLLTAQFNATVVSGVLTSSSYESSTGKWTYKIGGNSCITTIDASDLFMNNVQVITKGNSILAISSLNGTVLASGAVADYVIKTGDKLDGKTFDNGSASTSIYTIGQDTAVATSAANMPANQYNDWDKFEAIDYNGNGKIDAIVVYPTTVAQVTSLTDTTINNYTYGSKTAKSNTATLVGDIAKGDWVTVVANGETNKQKQTITKIELTEGALATASTTVNNVTTYTIGGKEYEIYNNESVTVGKSYKLGIVNGCVVKAIDATTGNSTNSLNNLVYVHVAGDVDVISTVDNTIGVTKTYAQRVGVHFSDGTSKVILVGAIYDSKTSKYVAVTDSNKLDQTANLSTNAGWYEWTETDGIYSLKAVTPAYSTYDFNGELTNITSIVKGEGSSNGTVLYANSGIFFVKYKDSKGNVVIGSFTGAQINAWKADASIRNSKLFYNNDTNTGAQVVSYGYFELIDSNSAITTLPAAAAAAGTYGYAVSNVSSVWNGKTIEDKVTMWNGKENVEYIITSNNVTIAKGGAYNLTLDSDGNITNAAPLTDAALILNTGSVVKFDNNANTYKLADDVTIIYVDSSEKVGATSGSVVLSDKANNNNRVNNVKAEMVYDNNTQTYYVNALIVDIKNKMN